MPKQLLGPDPFGPHAIAIYDKRQLVQHDFEYYTFVNNTDLNRVSALVGVVRSPKGDERLVNIGSTVLDPRWYGF